MTRTVKDIVNNLDNSTQVKLKPIHIEGKSSIGKSLYNKYFQNESKRKLIALTGNKRKKIVKSKYKKRFVQSKYYVPNLMKRIKGTVNRHQIFIGKTGDGINLQGN
jgi:hypothetical protein